MSPFRKLAVGVAVAVVVVLTSVAPAFAHDELLSSTPAAGDRLDSPPASVSLEFSADVMNVGALIVVVDAAGRDWAAGDPDVRIATVTVPIQAGMPAGGYEIRWRVVSSDGHPVAGAIPFTVGDAAPLQRSAPTADAGTAAPESGALATAAPESGQSTSDGGDALRFVLVGAAGAAVAVVLFVAITFIRRRTGSGGTDGPGH